jgi:hypothetical protein
MEALMVCAVGRYMAVGMAWVGAASWFLSGFGMSTIAMLSGAGVAGVPGFAQLEEMRANRIRMK